MTPTRPRRFILIHCTTLESREIPKRPLSLYACPLGRFDFARSLRMLAMGLFQVIRMVITVVMMVMKTMLLMMTTMLLVMKKTLVMMK